MYKIKEYSRRWRSNGFKINGREEEYLKVKTRHLRISILHDLPAPAPLRSKSAIHNRLVMKQPLMTLRLCFNVKSFQK